MLNQQLKNFIQSKSPALLTRPKDMLEFGCLQYHKEYLDEYSKFGLVKYFSEEEKNNSVADWPDDFDYYINDIGFRGHYPNSEDRRILASFGCSIAFGQGLPEDKIYADIIARRQQYLNLGIPGASCHRIALTFSAAVNVWDIDSAVVMLPPFTRFHYCDSSNRLQSILPAYSIDIDELESVRKNLVNNFSDQFLLSQAVDSIQWIIATARARNIKLILSSWDDEMIEIVKLAFNLDIVKFDIIDSARDGHPGVESHRQFADKVISNLTSGTYTC